MTTFWIGCNDVASRGNLTVQIAIEIDFSTENRRTFPRHASTRHRQGEQSLIPDSSSAPPVDLPKIHTDWFPHTGSRMNAE